MAIAYVLGFLSVIIICGITFFVTKLAYSRKWEDPDKDK